MLNLSFRSLHYKQEETLAYIVDDPVPLPALRALIEAPIVDELVKAESSMYKNLVDEDGKLQWQEERLSEAEDSVPTLYDPKDSFQNRNSEDLMHLDPRPDS